MGFPRTINWRPVRLPLLLSTLPTQTHPAGLRPLAHIGDERAVFRNVQARQVGGEAPEHARVDQAQELFVIVVCFSSCVVWVGSGDGNGFDGILRV